MLFSGKKLKATQFISVADKVQSLWL